jgi:P4 family phage/plasmid primase-like protien
MPPKHDPQLMRQALQVLMPAGQVVELRGLEVSTSPYPRPHVESGYFDDPQALVKAAATLTAKGLYITPNPLKPALLARAKNRVKVIQGQHGAATSDTDVIRRRWLLIDADPVRPSEISSSDAEHQTALARTREIRETLSRLGWADPVQADSGNGGHLLYPIDLPNNDESRDLIKGVLEALAFRFNDADVHIDEKVFNAARIWKLYGSLACKGDHTPERPHRLSRVLDIPETLTVITADQLRQVAAWKPTPPKPNRPRTGTYEPFDLERWIATHGLDVKGPTRWQKGQRWVFRVCPWNPDHTNRSAYIVQFSDGAIAAGCQHNGCSGNDWHALRDVMEPGWQDKRKRSEPRAKSSSATSTTSPSAPSQDGQLDDPHLTDLGNAKRFVQLWQAQVRFVTTWDKWLSWTGSCWKVDQMKWIDRLARETVKRMYAEAAQLEDIKARKALATWAMHSESRGKLEAMIALAQAELPIPMTHEQLDADPWAFNCANGTLDLRTGRLRPHRPDELFMKQSPVPYDPQAPCPRWERFLDEIMAGNRDLIDYLRRAIGSSLTADVSDQVLFFLYGGGANGKSKLLEAILSIMADYGMQAIPEFLTVRHNEQHPTERTDLFGKRFVATVEIEQGKALAEALVKQLTGGEKIRARRMREDFWEFEPTHKLWLAANHKPVIRGTDHAIWRRIKLIPFNVTFVDNPTEAHELKKDPAITAQLRAELPGILRWAVEGCLEWQKKGLDEPRAVTEAVDEYRREMNDLAQFLQECCYLPSPPRSDIKTQSSQLHDAYVKWSGDHLSPHAFAARLKEMGYINKPARDGRKYWLGIGLVVTDHASSYQDDDS